MKRRLLFNNSKIQKFNYPVRDLMWVEFMVQSLWFKNQNSRFRPPPAPPPEGDSTHISPFGGGWGRLHVSINHYSLFTIHYSLFIIHYSLFTIH
jgi:hypothetical protein